MRRTWLAVAAVGLVGLGFGAGRAASQDAGGEVRKGKDEATPPGPSPEEMVAWVKFMTPGPEHERMAGMTGE
jgi:hypothetical protein